MLGNIERAANEHVAARIAEVAALRSRFEPILTKQAKQLVLAPINNYAIVGANPTYHGSSKSDDAMLARFPNRFFAAPLNQTKCQGPQLAFAGTVIAETVACVASGAGWAVIVPLAFAVASTSIEMNEDCK